MARDNLLKEAIADAKTIRDTAIANAKISLEEAFKPHLASIISTRLRNEANDASSEIGGGAVTVKNPGPKQPSKAASDSSHIENPGLEIEDVFDGPTGTPKKVTENDLGFGGEEDELDLDIDFGGEGTPEMGLDAGIGGDDEFGGAPDAGMGGDDLGLDAGAPEGEFGAEGGDEISDLDLEAIIRELEMDVDGQSDLGMGAPQLESFQDAQAGEEVEGAFDGSLKETIAGAPGEGSTKDGKSPTSVHGVAGGKKVTPGQEVTGSKEERMMEEVDLDEILREIEDEEEKGNPFASKNIATENVSLKKNLREHREVIQYLRGKLQEVNMLNAKLLFTNKLFKSFDMNVGQKMKVVETFDRATTLREVKLIFTTLAESFSGKRVGSKKSQTRITEGLSSKAIGGTKPKAPQVLAEGNDMRERFMKLANIKTN
jgi:hypothetical protein